MAAAAGMARLAGPKQIGLPEILLNVGLVGRLSPGMLQDVEWFMAVGIPWQHSQCSPDPDQASFSKWNRVAGFELHIDHFIAEPMCGMPGVSHVWQ